MDVSKARKVAWVTGSSTGIGAATSLRLAASGYDVAVHYGSSEDEAREVARQVRTLDRDALLVRGNVASGEDARRMAREVEEHFGRLDVLVNNAGSMVERIEIEEMTEESWDRIMDVNLKSVYLITQSALPLMKRAGGGAIVNVSSIAARIGGSADSIAYAAAKGGVSTMTRVLAGTLREPDRLDAERLQAISAGEPYPDLEARLPGAPPWLSPGGPAGWRSRRRSRAEGIAAAHSPGTSRSTAPGNHQRATPIATERPASSKACAPFDARCDLP